MNPQSLGEGRYRSLNHQVSKPLVLRFDPIYCNIRHQEVFIDWYNFTSSKCNLLFDTQTLGINFVRKKFHPWKSVFQRRTSFYAYFSIKDEKSCKIVFSTLLVIVFSIFSYWMNWNASSIEISHFIHRFYFKFQRDENKVLASPPIINSTSTGKMVVNQWIWFRNFVSLHSHIDQPEI